ncbi:MAG: molybdopterin-guanine dinucleotide biosynthesis protein B [Roseitalea sp.]|jgi:molybdopterin-guanine dinucleotide biosynthesis protein B|nr:molybdopterin-guanine dinucleotide biosynthesis protein B [Roseitalea sp.]MBO6722642.1 molybdopterin-guanine dinucleotide biosynthesis protein B [Roseitalea sp.]MBO6741574.1 molybdopterin-guanine dinucleotide biosynthesis protein B [Roseitalea sp.]
MSIGPPRFGIVGWKNSGKTTMTANLTRELVRRGYRVATVKRAHAGFAIDKPGTDSDIHRKAGASQVAIIAPTRWALIHEGGSSETEPSLDNMIARLEPCDIVLVEGYKSAAHPKIELRADADTARPVLATTDPAIIAIACDDLPDETATGGQPVFRRNQTEAIATLVEQACGLGDMSEHKSAS